MRSPLVLMFMAVLLGLPTIAAQESSLARDVEQPSSPPPVSFVQAEDQGVGTAQTGCPSYGNVPGLSVDQYGNPFISNIVQFLDTCPQSDPNLLQILNDFQIRRDGVLVTSFLCTEPVSQMPVAQYTDELIALQVLRAMYYMDRGQSGHLPWTPGGLYDWMRAKLGGVNIVTGVVGGYCCTVIDGRMFFVGGTHDDYNREFDKTWDGISNVMAFYAHERRHLDGGGFPHSSCCGLTFGCDDNYDQNNLAPYAIQWWLEKSWLEGTINVGIGCLSQALIQQDALWHLGAANGAYASRFCYTKPPVLTMPATPGGPCNAPPCITITSMTSRTSKPGSPATIRGTGFSTTSKNDTVRFGTLKATVKKATATSLTVTIPRKCKKGTTYQVVVTVAGEGASNAWPFTVK